MSNAESVHHAAARNSRSIEVRVAAHLENLAVVRTVVAAIGTHEDLDLDAVADLRLAVDEACTRLIRSAAAGAELAVLIDPRADEVVVEASTTCAGGEDVLTPGSFSWHVLTSLTDDVSTFRDGAELAGAGQVFGISLTTRRLSTTR